MKWVEFSLKDEVDVNLRQVLVEGFQPHLILMLQSSVELMIPVLTPGLHVTRAEALNTHIQNDKRLQNTGSAPNPSEIRTVLTWDSRVANPVLRSWRPSFHLCCWRRRSTPMRPTTCTTHTHTHTRQSWKEKKHTWSHFLSCPVFISVPSKILLFKWY